MIENVSLVSELKQDFLTYSTAIFGRALPDIVDGLKTAQRRAILGIKDLGLTQSSHYIKVSRLEGHVLGFYHPQGGCAGTIINMGQESSQRYVLTDIHGNVGGSIQTGEHAGQMVSGDPPAAARYLEVRSTDLCDKVYLSQIDKNLGTWKPNYDGTCKELVRIVPVLPMALLTGSHGIASGYACSHISYALSDVIRASTSLIKNPKLTDKQLLGKFNHPPEPPQGGRIVQEGESLAKVILTGSGPIISYGKWFTEDEVKWGKRSVRPAITITHLASGSSESFLERVRDLAEAEKLPGLLDAADYSSRDGIKIVLVFKTITERDMVLPLLVENTGLRHKHSVNSVVVGLDGKPRTSGVREIVMAWYDQRVKYLCEKYTEEVDVLKKKIYFLECMLKVLDDIDLFVGIVREGEDKEVVIDKIARVWKFDREIAKRIIAIPISSLIHTEIGSVKTDCEKLQSEMSDLKKLCVSGPDLDNHICDQIASLRHLGGPARAVWMTQSIPQTPQSPAGKKDRMREEAESIGLSTRAFNKWLRENVGGKGNLNVKWSEYKHSVVMRTRAGKAQYRLELETLRSEYPLPVRGKSSWNTFLRSLPSQTLPIPQVRVELSKWHKTHEKTSKNRSAPASSSSSQKRSCKEAAGKRKAGVAGEKRGSGERRSRSKDA